MKYPDDFSAYKLPHHDIEDGHLVLSRPGLMAAGAVMQGARGGVDLPDAEKTAVKNHLEQHYHALGMKAPWEAEHKMEEKKASTDNLSANAGHGATNKALGGVDNAGGVPINRAEPDADDDQPATRGWFKRTFGGLFGSKTVGSGPVTTAVVETVTTVAPLQIDGTPSPEIRAEAVVAPVAPADLEAQAMAASEQRAVAVRKNAEKSLERALRSYGYGMKSMSSMDGSADKPMDFDAEWNESEISEEAYEATELLDDVLHSALCNLDQFPSSQALLDHVHAQLTAYLESLTEILKDAASDAGVGVDGALAALRGTFDRSTAIKRQLLRQVARAHGLVDAEQRLGAKYSGDTVDKIRNVHEALKTALSHTGDMMSEIDKQNAQRDTAGSPIPGGVPDPLKEGSRPGDVKPEDPAASAGTIATAGDLGPKGEQTPAGEGPKMPGDPKLGTVAGQAGQESVIGTQGGEGPGKAESYPRAAVDAIKQLGADFKSQLSAVTARLAALETGAPAPAQRAAEPVKPTDPVLGAIAEMRAEVTGALGQIEQRVVAVEKRRQGSNAGGDPPVPPVTGEQRSKDGWGEGILGPKISGAKARGSR